jgi:integrase
VSKVMYNYTQQYLQSKDGIFYFVRRVPVDVQPYYSSKRISFSLKTRSLNRAMRACNSILQRLEDYWLGLRLQKMDIPAIHLVMPDAAANESNAPLLSDALDLYLKLKGVGKDKVFIRTATRNVEYVVKVLGNRSIEQYSSADASVFRDWLIDQGMSIKTVKRVFSSIRAIINITITEEGLDCSNAFSKTFFPEDVAEVTRKPIPIDDIREIQALCQSQDDDMRWLIALISDTGMRLGEAAGLVKSDIKLDDTIPHIDLKPHPWRTLKTKGSQRKIPLVGAALWAARRLLQQQDNSLFCFPRYCSEQVCKTNSASGGLNKWLHEHVPDGCVVHSFRHSIRDRLRAVECPSDIVDAIGGWRTAGVGQGYGEGYSLEVLGKWMSLT